jgi:hypothetical protein
MNTETPKKPQVPQYQSDISDYPQELIDHYWGSINYILELVKSSELKAGLILSFYGIVLSFIYKKIEVILTDFSNSTFLYILIGLWFFSTLVSIYYSFRCFMPRKETKFKKNIFFFGDIITKFGDVDEFSKTFYDISLDKDRLFDQLGQQIFILSKIAASKFKNVNKSLQFLGLGMLLILISMIYRLMLLM